MKLLYTKGPTFIVGQKPMTPFLYLAPRTEINKDDQTLVAFVPVEVRTGGELVGHGHARRPDDPDDRETYEAQAIEPDADLLSWILSGVPDPSVPFEFSPTKIGQGLYVWKPTLFWQGEPAGSPAEG